MTNFSGIKAMLFFHAFIFNLQSEIHMSEEAIQDILEQTESDPAFQALFDLFDYGNFWVLI